MADIGRREFAGIAGSAVASLLLGGGCSARAERDGSSRISARPHSAVEARAAGSGPLGLANGRDAILHVPANAPAKKAPLFVLLHGASGSGANMLRRIVQFIDESGIVTLSPDSRDSTWDAIRGEFGPDVRFINSALERVFDRVDIDPDRVAVGGFSDGATYALSLGLANGDLFRRIVAFSPGFFVGGAVHGRPRIYVSHGTGDDILPIDRCSRVIVPALERQGYEVTFRTFDGGHMIPPNLAREGMKFLLSAS